MLHRFALAPGDDVNPIDAGGQSQLLADRRVLTVRFSDVLLIVVDESHVLTVRALFVKDDPDEIDSQILLRAVSLAHGRR